jgi:hypothetical protein
MWILVLALLAVIIWLVLRQPGRTGVSASALNSLQEADALVVNGWRKLDALIDATPDPDLTCARMVAMQKGELPPQIVELWQYLDDITETSNRRAEHYEIVARKPAPALSGRSVSDAIIAGIRRRAARAESARKPLIEKAPAFEQPAPAKPDIPKAPSAERSTQRTLLPEVRDAFNEAKKLMAALGHADDQQVAARDVFKLAQEATGLTKHTLELIALQISVLTGGTPRETGIRMLREQEVHFKGLCDVAAEDARKLVDPVLELYEIFLPVLEEHAEKAGSGPAIALGDDKDTQRQGS